MLKKIIFGLLILMGVYLICVSLWEGILSIWNWQWDPHLGFNFITGSVFLAVGALLMWRLLHKQAEWNAMDQEDRQAITNDKAIQRLRRNLRVAHYDLGQAEAKGDASLVGIMRGQIAEIESELRQREA